MNIKHRILQSRSIIHSLSLLKLNAHRQTGPPFPDAIINLASIAPFHSCTGNHQQQQINNNDTTTGNPQTDTHGRTLVQIPVTFEHGHFKLYLFDRYVSFLKISYLKFSKC